MTSTPATPAVIPLAALLLAAMFGAAGTAHALPRPSTRPAGSTPSPAAVHPVVEAPDPYRPLDPRRNAGDAASGTEDRPGGASPDRRDPHPAEPYWTARTFPPAPPPYGMAASYPPPPYVPAYPQLPGYPPLPPR